MKTYIRKSIKGFYIQFPEEIDATYWAGKIGSTYEDFRDNKWILLSEEQEAFHNEHTNASVREVLNMELDAVVEPNPIEVAKLNKIDLIRNYDSGSEINDFTVNGETHAWFTPEQRSNYRNSVDAAKILGVENLNIFVGDNLLTIPTSVAEQALASIQLYADQCYIKTKQHIAAVEALTTVEEIDNYDYTVGYPAKLNFTL